MHIVWGIIALIVIFVIIGLTIWLLVRSTTNKSTSGGTLGVQCSTDSNCNPGLVCQRMGGLTGMVGITQFGVCKVANGGVCNLSADCANGYSCQSGLCVLPLSGLNGICPCQPGFTCVGNTCKIIPGGLCILGSDCSSGVCEGGICTIAGVTGSSGSTGNCNICDENCDSGCDSSRDSCSRDSRDDCSRDSRDDNCSRDDYSRDDYSREVSGDKYSSYDRSSRKDYDSSIYSCSKTDCSKTIFEEEACKKKLDRKICSDLTSSGDSSYCSCSESGSRDCMKCSKGKSSKYSESSEISESSKSRETEVYSGSIDYDSNDTPYSGACDKSKKQKCEKSNKTNKKCYDTDPSYSSWNSNCDSQDERSFKRGVYVTNESDQDQTLFTGIDSPILDVAKTDRIYLLLKNGNVAANSGMSNIFFTTNRRLQRMVRFGTDIIGWSETDRQIYVAMRNGSKWSWDKLCNSFPKDIEFINSTNNGSHLEVKSCGKSYLYTFSSNWKNSKLDPEIRKSDTLRFYGGNVSRYIDIDEKKQKGVTDDGEKYYDIKAAGFYPGGSIVSVLSGDTFTHVRVIDNNAYFLFEQC